MITLKNLYVSNFEKDYRKNIQLQFNDDERFINFISSICQVGIDFQDVLKGLSEGFQLTPGLFDTITPENTFILNSIGSLLNIPPMDYFNDYMNEGSYDIYLLILNGQIAKNNYDGTNIGLINTLNRIFPQYKFVLEDTGEMSIKIYLVSLTEETIPQNIIQLFDLGYFTPKPAGVNITYVVADDIYFAFDTDYVAGPPQLGKWDNSIWRP